METLQIKIILERSNPSLVREFNIPGDYTFSQLHTVISLALAWQPQKTFKFWSEGILLEPEQKINILTMETFYYECNEAEPWTFRGKVLDRTEQAEGYPQVLRYRGENPPIELTTIQDVNRQQAYWNGDGLGYYYGVGRQYSLDNYQFSLVQTNRILRRKFGGEKASAAQERIANLDYQSAVSTSKLLQSVTLEEMKRLARVLQIKMPSNLRKSAYITFLSEELAKAEPLEHFLDSITSGEYKLFQKICEGKATWLDGPGMANLLNRLSRCGYVGMPYYYYSYDPQVEYSRELLMAYEEWLERNDEKEYLIQAELRTLLVGGVRLYGVMQKDIWLKLAGKLLPEYCITEETDKLWYSMEMAGIEYGILANEDELYYDTYAIGRQEIDSFISNIPKVSRYIPKMVTFEKIVLQDMSFEGTEGERLERELLYCGVRREQAYSLNREIYKQFRQGKTAKEVMHSLSNSIRTKNRTALLKLEKELSALRLHVRQITLLGHTQKETERLCMK